MPIIKCDRGNEITIPMPTGKYTQFRDYLETKQFHFSKADIKNGELKKFKVECDKCKRHIIVGVD